jgi:thioesterase domain-containing protein/acyl carrier protein
MSLKSAEVPGRYAEPSNSYEMMLTGIWREILGRDRIGVDDHFFEVGGHSLLAVRMIAQIEAALGKKVPLRTLFAHPTIRALAREISAPEGLKCIPVIPIRREGTRAPFFLFYGDLIPGPGFCFELAKALGDDQPLHIVPISDIPGYPAYPSLEETAAALIGSVRQIRPHGPYLIGGYCYGGFVAYEAARQLEAAGERVELLILVDSLAPKRPFLRLVRQSIRTVGGLCGTGPVAQRRVFEFVSKYASKYRFWLNLNGLERVKYLKIKFDEWFSRYRRRQERGGDGGRQVDAPAQSYLQLLGWRKLALAFNWERAGYSARPYAGPVVLFASESAWKWKNEPTYGWGELAAKLEVHPIPGNHGACVTSHRDFLFEKLRARLAPKFAPDSASMARPA